MKIMLVKNLNGSIIAAYDEDKDKLKKFKVGEMFQAEVTKPRNIAFHKKFFALLNMVFENQEIYHNIEHLRHDLTIEAGRFEEGVNWQGELVKRPKSISFAKMDDYEFSEFYESVLNTIVKCFNFDKEDIIENVLQYY